MITWKEVLDLAKNGNKTPDRRVEKTEAEWKAILTPAQFKITRLKGTERRGTGELCSVYEPGIYNCICCDTSLFDSTVKYDSGTGWPSFTEPIKDNVINYETDYKLIAPRVEVMCSICDSHLGHVFKYGPKGGGLRYCINSESLKLNKNEK